MNDSSGKTSLYSGPYRKTPPHRPPRANVAASGKNERVYCWPCDGRAGPRPRRTHSKPAPGRGSGRRNKEIMMKQIVERAEIAKHVAQSSRCLALVLTFT